MAAAVVLLSASAPAQEVQTGVEIISFESPWEFLMLLNSSGVQQDPASVDADFLQTWTTAGYDGPPFKAGAAPISYGGVDYFTNNLPGSGTQLPVPTPGSRGTIYLRTTIALTGGLTNIQMESVADDGFILYVDGVRWVSRNMPETASSGFGSLSTTVLSENVVTVLPGVGAAFPALTRGSHTIHVSLHNVNFTSSDLGFALRLKGDLTLPGPAMTAEVSAPSTDGSPRVLLRATGLSPATPYFVQQSTDLVNWVTVDTVAAAENRTGFTLDVPAIFGHRYFRLAK